jgi:phosphomannomutase
MTTTTTSALSSSNRLMGRQGVGSPHHTYLIQSKGLMANAPLLKTTPTLMRMVLSTPESSAASSFSSSSSSSSSSYSVASSSADIKDQDVNGVKRTNDDARRVGLASDAWLQEYFHSDIDDVNVPPSLNIIRRSFGQLASGSDIRGQFVDQPRGRSMAAVAHSIGKSNLPALTPFAAHCLGYAFATMVHEQERLRRSTSNNDNGNEIVICIGRDPREHGTILADAFARGAGGVPNVKVVYTGIATTPSLFEFCRYGFVFAIVLIAALSIDSPYQVTFVVQRAESSLKNLSALFLSLFSASPLFSRSSLCQGGVIVTASHLPMDRNGFKFFSSAVGGFTKHHIQRMIDIARDHCQIWFDMGTIPPRSGVGGVFAKEFVNWMPHYEQQLKKALHEQVDSTSTSQTDLAGRNSGNDEKKPLKGLKIVLNAGHGSGSFFRKVLEEMGADVKGSIHTTVDGNFPQGVPNPEYPKMISETIDACEEAHADLGILLDTDADRCGMVAPRSYKKMDGESGLSLVPSDYEPLNRNRLIALMGVIYARQAPGCAIVTDSVTSNGLSKFLVRELGLRHIRYLRGYANVIAKAQSLIEQGQADAQVAIETSGHCAVRENGFLDDGTFTAIKVLGLLAQERRAEMEDNKMEQKKSLLGLIAALEEHEEVEEFRLPALDGTLESMRALFDFLALEIECACDEHETWSIDTENLEGVRISLGGRRQAANQKDDDNGFFLIRKSLHDPVICLQVEARSKNDAKELVVEPLLKILGSEPRLRRLGFDDLSTYAEL